MGRVRLICFNSFTNLLNFKNLLNDFTVRRRLMDLRNQTMEIRQLQDKMQQQPNRLVCLYIFLFYLFFYFCTSYFALDWTCISFYCFVLPAHTGDCRGQHRVREDFVPTVFREALFAARGGRVRAGGALAALSRPQPSRPLLRRPGQILFLSAGMLSHVVYLNSENFFCSIFKMITLTIVAVIDVINS